MRIMSLVMGVILGGAAVWFCIQHHIVRTNDGFTSVPKQSTTLADSYVDVRQWGPIDWAKHPDLALSLAQNGHKDLVVSSESVETAIKDVFRSK